MVHKIMDKPPVLKNFLIITHNINVGGAARAVERLYSCFYANNKNTKLIVLKSPLNKNEFISLTPYRKLIGMICSRFDIIICNFLIPHSTEWTTGAFFGALKSKHINNIDVDIVNLHWLGHGLISFRQLARIKKPIIWTLHDEWALYPISHYPPTPTSRKKNFINKTIGQFILNNRETKKKKFIHQNNVHLVTLNKEIADKFKVKYPEKMEKIFTIQNPLDLKIFSQENRNNFTNSLIIPNQLPNLLFLGGLKDKRKGWDLLEDALKYTNCSFNLIVIGGEDKTISNGGNMINLIGLNKITNLPDLIDLYSNVLAVMVPSRIEGLPQTATESLSCGTPVIGFNIGGLRDIVFNYQTGFIVEAFNTRKLGQAIDNVIKLGKEYFNKNCRSLAEKEFSYDVVFARYNSILKLPNYIES
jgi:glycosyltransferase involved in cell wall biosynthesis